MPEEEPISVPDSEPKDYSTSVDIKILTSPIPYELPPEEPI